MPKVNLFTDKYFVDSLLLVLIKNSYLPSYNYYLINKRQENYFLAFFHQGLPRYPK